MIIDVESGGVLMMCDVECYVMWNEAECGLWHGMWNVVRCGMRQSVGCGMACCAMWNEVVWAVAWNVERCAMWNEAECGLWHECGTLCGVE